MTKPFYRRGSSGKKWSARENQLVETFYPDYQELQHRLKTRSYYAIRTRARTLGIAASRHIWTTHDIANLRSLYLRGATRSQVAEVFPHLTQSQICGKARHIRLVRTRRDPYKLDIPPLDAVRKQATVKGWSWRKLDKLARTGRYFQQTTRRVDWTHLARAIEKLGGTIEIAWKP
jgi:hypothetical protein